MRRLRLRRIRALRSMSRSSIRPHIRKVISSRRVTAKRRTMSAAFIVNPFGAILCSPKRAKLKKCLSRSFARIYKNQCTYLYRTIFR